ncbi:MAG: HIT domain-containing protein [Patescibacteria group bacterium]
MECIFCKIAEGVLPSDTVFENAKVKAFRDIHPKATVHILIIPKIHIASVAELTEAHDGAMAALLHAAKDIARDQNLAGYKLLFNVGREAGQVVDHLHLHLLGGWGKNGKVKSLDV